MWITTSTVDMDTFTFGERTPEQAEAGRRIEEADGNGEFVPGFFNASNIDHPDNAKWENQRFVIIKRRWNFKSSAEEFAAIHNSRPSFTCVVSEEE